MKNNENKIITSNLVKYPRTAHVPWSPGATSDDVFLMDTQIFLNQNVIITEKLDGENTTIYRDYVHARSLDSRHHISRDWVKNLQAQIGHEIPENWRLCGENVWAKHSIEYNNLKSYFYGFSIWDENNMCLSWKDTIEYFNILGIYNVPVLFKGVYTTGIEKEWKNKKIDESKMEGCVIRLADSFPLSQFKTCVGKYVRPNHVQSDKHWMNSEIFKNKLKGD